MPFFISNLGIAAYGLIPLMTSITGYVAIVVQSLNTAVSRFLTVDLHKEDYVAANKTFSTSFFGLSAAILLMIPMILIVARFIPSLFHVPAGQERDAIILFLGVCAAFLIRSWAGNFTVQLFAYNRLDLQNLVNLVNLVVQIGLIFVSFSLFGPDLALVGGSYFIGAVLASVTSIILAQHVCPYLSLSIRSFDRTKLKDLYGMGGWVVINNVGALLFLQIDLIVVNLLFGASTSGKYAIALQWAILLRSFAGVLSGALTPIIFSFYANEKTEALVRITKSSIKLMGFAVALPIGLICGFAPQIISIWVGSEFINIAPLMIILTAHLSINLAVLPLFSINVAFNRMRVQGIAAILMGGANTILAIILSFLPGWGYYGVAVAGAIILTMKNAFFTPWYATKVLGIEAHTFTRSMLSGLAMTMLIGILAATIAMILPFTPTMLAIAGMSITIIYLGVIWSFGLSKSERGLFKSYLPLAFRRFLS